MAQFPRTILTALAIVLSTSLYLIPADAHAQKSGNPMRGAALADSWCSSCHIIDKKGGGNAVDPAPPFPVIANDPKKTSAYLQAWLSTRHPQMPNFNLARREIMDLSAYIRSLSTVR